MARTALTAVLIVLAWTAAASASPGTVYVSNCGKLVQHPKTIVLACADANYELTRLSWKSWGGPVSAAVGKVSANTCTPNCAAGKFHSYPVKVAALEARKCGAKLVYLKLTIAYTGATRPAGHAKHENWTFTCAQATHG